MSDRPFCRRSLPMFWTRLVAGAAMGLPVAGSAQMQLGPGLGNAPSAQTVPTSPSEEAMQRGAEAVGQYVRQYGPLSMTVAVSYLDAQGRQASETPPIADALAAEVEKQLGDYTDDRITLTVESLNRRRAQRLTDRAGGPASGGAAAAAETGGSSADSFLTEVAELGGSPYVLAIEVSPDTSGVKDAGSVSLRLIEVATGRVLTSVSDQFWQDKQRYPHVPDAAWVQHSVTYWMEELMDRRGLPRALEGPYLASLRFVGELPSAARQRLPEILAAAVGVPRTAVNPRHTRQAYDVVAVDLMLDRPPHVVLGELIRQVGAGLAEQGLRAEPLRQSGGDVIFAVTSSPTWYAVTEPIAGGSSTDIEDAGPVRQAWGQLLEELGQPALAVISYTDPAVASAGGDGSDAALVAGQGRALAQAVEAQWIAAGLEVLGIEPASAPYGGDAQPAAGQLRQRARWVCYVEAVPAEESAGSVRLLARLVDLQNDRVLGAAGFPSAEAKIPAGAASLDRLQLAARYLTGSLIADAVANPAAHQTLRLRVEKCPSFEFGQRIGRIAMAQPDVANVVLPSFDAQDTYTLEVRHLGSAESFAERLRADLSSLPLRVGAVSDGRMTLTYTP